jgi:hypothetical protein
MALDADRASYFETVLGEEVCRTTTATGMVRDSYDGTVLGNPPEALCEIPCLNAQVNWEAAVTRDFIRPAYVDDQDLVWVGQQLNKLRVGKDAWDVLSGTGLAP